MNTTKLIETACMARLSFHVFLTKRGRETHACGPFATQNSYKRPSIFIGDSVVKRRTFALRGLRRGRKELRLFVWGRPAEVTRVVAGDNVRLSGPERGRHRPPLVVTEVVGCV